MAVKKTKKKASKKRTPHKVKKATSKKKRVPNAAFMAPRTPDAVLGEVVGHKPLPSTQVVKKLWEYINKRHLKDKVNKQMINADSNLKAVFGGKNKVTMFEMIKLVHRHLK